MSAVNSGKPQFGPWLLEQLQAGQFEGLCMIDNDTFRIPWKHNSRKDCGDEDNRIFREWAMASGKIMEYPSDKAKWKANFRCALNSLKQFKLLHDNSKDEKNPHKLYRIIWSENKVCPAVPIEHMFISPDDGSEAMEHDLPDHMGSLNLGQQPAETSPWPAYQQQNLVVPNNFCALSVPAMQQQQQQQHCLMSNVPAPAPVFVQQPYATGQQNPALPYIFDLEISIHYRKIEMRKVKCTSPFVQLHAQCDQCELKGESVPFPSTEELTDHKQIQYTKRILSNIKRGLLLGVHPTGIYGYRQDKCNVFFSTSDPTEIQNQAEPRKLLQNHEELLFSFEKYKKDLIAFTENRGGSPEYTIYLCFGEKFPDGKPLEKKLIFVKVVPLRCRELHKLAQMEGASSLQNDSISLQFSHNSLYELIDTTFPLPIAE